MLTVLIALSPMGCGPRSRDGYPVFPNDPDEVSVISLDGATAAANDLLLTDEQRAGGVFCGFPVLGRAEVVDPAQRRAVVAAVRGGVEEAERENTPKVPCFYPRHAVRAVKGGREVDVVICFECNAYLVHPGPEAETIGGGRITGSPRAELDRILTAAGVPIAPALEEVAKKRQATRPTGR